MAEKVQWYKLNSGHSIPAVGLGVSALGETPEQTKINVLKAIDTGFRHFDTASMYKSEKSLGDALHESFDSGKLKRSDVFVTTKLNLEDMNPPEISGALKSSLAELRLDYVDLYLIHWPIRVRHGAQLMCLGEDDFLPVDLKGCWAELEAAHASGLARSIGVSNCSPKTLMKIEETAKIVPAVNQVEMHPGCEQAKLLDYCKNKGILITAWSPLGAPGSGVASWGTGAIVDSPILKEIAAKHGKVPGQVALRWGVQQGVGVVVRSSNPVRLAQNLDIFYWTLDDEDFAAIKKLPSFRVFDGEAFCNSTTSPYKSAKELWDEE